MSIDTSIAKLKIKLETGEDEVYDLSVYDDHVLINDSSTSKETTLDKLLWGDNKTYPEENSSVMKEINDTKISVATLNNFVGIPSSGSSNESLNTKINNLQAIAAFSKDSNGIKGLTIKPQSATEGSDYATVQLIDTETSGSISLSAPNINLIPRQAADGVIGAVYAGRNGIRKYRDDTDFSKGFDAYLTEPEIDNKIQEVEDKLPIHINDFDQSIVFHPGPSQLNYSTVISSDRSIECKVLGAPVDAKAIISLWKDDTGHLLINADEIKLKSKSEPIKVGMRGLARLYSDNAGSTWDYYLTESEITKKIDDNNIVIEQRIVDNKAEIKNEIFVGTDAGIQALNILLNNISGGVTVNCIPHSSAAQAALDFAKVLRDLSNSGRMPILTYLNEKFQIVYTQHENNNEVCSDTYWYVSRNGLAKMKVTYWDEHSDYPVTIRIN